MSSRMSSSSNCATMSERPWLLDVNVLVALTVDVHVHHTRAHAALAGCVGGWATCPITETALLRLLTNPLVTGRRITAADALAVLVGIRRQPGWEFVADRSSLTDPQIDTTTLIGTKQVTDFHLVNLAATENAVLVTFDGRLPGALSPADRRHVEVIGARPHA